MKLFGNFRTQHGSASDRAMSSVTISANGEKVLHAFEANTFLSRLRGLFAHLPINDRQALIITPCSAIHTFGMPSAIDAVFVANNGTVLQVRTLVARRWCSVPDAVAVIETNAHVCQQYGIEAGTRLVRDTGVWK